MSVGILWTATAQTSASASQTGYFHFMSVFVLAFVVEVVVGYNPIMHKTQPQKLFFLVFYSFFSGSTPKLNLNL